MTWQVQSGLVLLMLAGCSRAPEPAGNPNPPASGTVRWDQSDFAASRFLADTAHNPFANDAKAVEAGRQLFASMNCDGCHAGGEGWVAPSLNDGRWKYGGSDGAIFQTIYFGRPNGMPGFGDLLAPPVIWQLVAYVRSLPQSKAVPTQSW